MQDVQVNADLIRELECAHRHLVELAGAQGEPGSSSDILALSTNELVQDEASRREVELQWTSSHQIIPSGKEGPSLT